MPQDLKLFLHGTFAHSTLTPFTSTLSRGHFTHPVSQCLRELRSRPQRGMHYWDFDQSVQDMLREWGALQTGAHAATSVGRRRQAQPCSQLARPPDST